MQLLTILKNINSFKKSKELILMRWSSYDEPKKILLIHKVDIDLFTHVYASGVFEYFMDVIKGEKAIGDCPVMHEFLFYLKDRDVSANELFLICSYFRRSIIDFVYENKIDSKELLAEISYLFDTNFSGVLSLYVDTIYQKDRVIEKNIELLNEYKKVLDESAIVSKTDEEGIFTYANEKFCEICGYSQEELIGKSYMILRDCESSDALFEGMWEELNKNKIYKGRIKNRKKSGESFYLDITMLPINDATEFIAVGYEVTYLVETRQDALAESKAKESFLSSMSHEIRTPLNAILGFVAILLEDEKDLKHASYLRIINESGETLLGIINDILDFSKLKSGSFVIEEKVFNPYDEFSHILELFSQSAYEKNILLNFSIANSFPQTLSADKLRIKQVFSNLLSNAIKFTPEGGEVNVKILYKAKKVTIIVADNGKGVADETILFEAFKQDKETLGGTGLGLSISKDLAKHMKGELKYKKNSPKGSIFEFSFEVGLASTQERKKVSKDNTKQRRFKGKVLVAEDNSANQELMRVILNRCGVEFVIVSNGLDALNTFKSGNFDLVLMDKQMPIKDGVEATKNILEYETSKAKKHTPIVGLSANVMSKNLQWDAFLAKPFVLYELENILAKYLEEEKSVSIEKSACSLVTPALNLYDLKNELGLEESEVVLLLETFMKKMKKSLPLLLKAIENKEYHQLSLEAHSIKGSSANFRFKDLEGLAALIEEKAKKKDENFKYISTFEEIEKIIANLMD